MAKKIKLLLLTTLVGIGVALIYFYFELIVRHSIDYIWNDLLHTEDSRWLVAPLCISLTLLYFGFQHMLDQRAEQQPSSHTQPQKPSIQSILKVLFLGFLSLIAGASLGPEAILVPACVLFGSFVGVKSGAKKENVQQLGILGFVALLAAFFSSFIVGLLSLLLVKKQFKARLNTDLVVLAIAASASTTITLHFLKSSAFVNVPEVSWSITAVGIVLLGLLFAAGFITTHFLQAVHSIGRKIIKVIAARQWWLKGLVAGLGVSLLYLLGGPLVQFTGNEAIVPMLKQAANLGFIGLLVVLIVKLLAIGWSKVSGYRGGLVFPSVFAASVLVAMVQLYTNDLNFIYGLVAVMAGMITADSRVKILF